MRIPGGSRGKFITPTNLETRGNWNIAEQHYLNLNNSWANISPVMSGLVGYYTADTFTSTEWKDISGNNNHASVSGSPSVVSVSPSYGSSKSFNAVQGTYADSIIWPTAILPSSYTMFYVARYNTANSSTAATIRNSNNGSSTSGFSTPFGYPITSANGEVRVNYNNSAGDIIWIGLYGFMDSASVSAGNTYMVHMEGRVSDSSLANGSNYMNQQWDSQVNLTDIQNTVVTMSTERRFHSYIFTANSGFSLGNRWMRGMTTASSVFGADKFSYWRNNYVFQLPQLYTNQIFSGYDRAWYSGFFAGNAGSAYHGNELTIANQHSNNWVLGVDSNAGPSGQLFRTNKVDRYNSGNPSNPGTTYARLSINPYQSIASNFQVSEVIVYNRGLSASEYQTVENYLSQKYGVA